MKLKSPNINRILYEDLVDPERLTELYIQAVGNRYWDNDERALLDFFALSEKALQEDRHGTPEKLFTWQVKNKHLGTITNTQEIRAEDKLRFLNKRKIVETAENRKPKSGWHIQADMGESHEIIATRDVAYVPAVMTQVFFPQKAPPKDQDHYESEHGMATVLVRRGILIHPDWPQINKKEFCQIPSGSKARIILPYIVSTAIRDYTREIDMGHSLRQFMESVGMPVSGQNARDLTQQVKNIASAQIIFGYRGENYMRQRNEFIASAVDFWIEKDERQQTLWNPKLELSQNFYELIHSTNMPFYMPHVIQLSKSPRRMDLYMFLCHRTPRIAERKTVHIPLRAIQRIFAPDITRPRDFKTRLRNDMKAIANVYPHFKAEIKGDILALRKSPPPIPPRSTVTVPRIRT